MKKVIIFISGLFIVSLILVLFSPTPSEDYYYKWLEDEYNIKRTMDKDGFYDYTKDDINISFSNSSAKLGAKEENFKYENGETLTIRSYGIFGKFFEIDEDSVFWKLLYQ
ncbi:MAG: hypothetical protein ACTHW2_05370 [Tissierella sp.]|uniref:hypothetical protein n=1 Tax=Tissierella sp. TaxID=41274 RepID=UPI003F97091D